MFVVEPFGVFPSAFFMTQFGLRSLNIIRTHIAKHEKMPEVLLAGGKADHGVNAKRGQVLP
jgi:hypothetical protein